MVEKTQKEVAEGGQGLGGFAGTAGIFGQDGISFVVELVLDGPVMTADVGKGSGISLSRAKAGDGEVGFFNDLACPFVGLVAVDFDNLLQAREG